MGEMRDYSLVGENAKKAVEAGLSEATWYTCPVPREQMIKLLARKNIPAVTDTLIWFGLLFGSGYLVFLLWGKFAQEKARLIDESKHCILRAAHPSPLSAYAGFFGCRHFSKANHYLMENGVESVDWQVV